MWTRKVTLTPNSGNGSETTLARGPLAARGVDAQKARSLMQPGFLLRPDEFLGDSQPFNNPYSPYSTGSNMTQMGVPTFTFCPVGVRRPVWASIRNTTSESDS